MTDRLYYHDATLQSFSARVVEVTDGNRKVYLDRTAFYPTSGGQQHDLGTLGGAAVADVVDEGERIAHVLSTPLTLAEGGTEVRGEIDWRRRFDHMQQHTGQHLLSAVIEDHAGLATLSVHFGAETSTLDVADARGQAKVLGATTLAEIELRANELVADARPVVVTFQDAASATGLRKPSDREGMLRIVNIEGVDRSACGGTHVATTAQIGPVLLRRQEKVKQGLRLEFVCGRRAIKRARGDLDALSTVARLYSAAIDDVPRLAEAQAAQLRDHQGELKRAVERLAAYRAVELHAAAEVMADGVRVVTDRVEGGVDASRTLALAFASLEKAVFVVASHAPPAVLVATSADSGIDAGKLLKSLLERVGGRGGGSPRLAQGSAPSAETVDEVVRGVVMRDA